MPHKIEPSILRILNSKNQTVGTGFLVSKNLAVTCAHVTLSASMDDENRIRVQFMGEKQIVSAKVLDDCFDIDRDVAILQVDEVPAGIAPVRLGRASESRLKNDLYTYGYALAAGEQGIGGLGIFIRQDGNFVQFRMHEADHGHSGAPLYDDKRGVVVGIVKKGKDTAGRNAETTYAISTETIWRVCPQLKPPPTLSRDPMVEGINLLPYDYDQRIQNFLVEYLGSEQNPVPFGGRDNALNMLDDWLAGSMPYLMLAAPAGRGKSALLVRWLDRLQAREDLALAFVPVSIRFGTNMERVFYAALAARLAYLHGDPVANNAETSAAVYRGLVNDCISKPLADGRTLLVILDGIDEAADWQAGADFLPNGLPAGVRVAVSARFLAGDVDPVSWLRRLNWSKNQAYAPLLIPLDKAGVTDVLFKMGCPLDELSRNVDIVAELYRLSEGDPLLVSLYVGDLWTKGMEVTRLKPEDLANIRPGYKGYFDRWWNDQRRLWKDKKPWLEKHVRAVRNLLAGALGPLFIGDIHALDPKLESDYVADALDMLQRFIIGDKQIQGYTFSHPKLGQYFWDALTPTEQVQVEGRFLVWGKQTLNEFSDGKRDVTKKAEVPAYIVSNYGAHLARAQQPIENWLPLIHNQQWALAWLTLEGAYGGYLQDVQRVWEQCKIFDRKAVEANGKALYLGDQIRCGLIEASIHSLAGKVPTLLIWPLVRDGIWTLPQAWVSIRQISDPQRQARALITLIPFLADEQLLEALSVGRDIKDEWHRVYVLSVLARRLPEVSREALQAARVIHDERVRASALSTLAEHLPEADLGDVLQAARVIQDDGDRASILNVLAGRLLEADLGQVLQATRAIQNDGNRAGILSILTVRLPEANLKQVLQAARAIQSNKDRATVLSVLAGRLPEVSTEALQAADAIQSDESRAYVLSVLARNLPEIGAEALQAARAIRDEWPRASMLSTLARHLPEVGVEALQTAQAIESEENRTGILEDLARHLPEADLGQVLQAARAIKSEWHRARVLSALARRLPEADLGQILQAARTIQSKRDHINVLSVLAGRLPGVSAEVLQVTQVIQDHEAHTRMLSALVSYLSKTELRQVLQAALTIQSERDRVTILRSLARHLPEANLGDVLQAAQVIQDERSRASVLIVLAGRLPEADMRDVLQAAWAIQNEMDRASVLSVLVDRLPKADLRQVLQAARAIQDDESRAHLLSALAVRLPGVSGEVLKAARAIRDEWYQARILIVLAGHLPEADLGQVLQTAWTIQNIEKRASVLSVLARRIPEVELGHVLQATWVIQSERDRASILNVLAGRLHEADLGQVLQVARAIHNQSHRAFVLSALAKRLPGISIEALKVVQAIHDEWHRARLLSALAECLPEISTEALEAAQVIQDDDARARVLSILAQSMFNTPARECYRSLETSIPRLAQYTRAHFFYDISALMPVIVRLGTEDTAHEIFHAVRDVIAWWL